MLGVAHLCCAGGRCDQIVEQLFKKIAVSGLGSRDAAVRSYLLIQKAA